MTDPKVKLTPSQFSEIKDLFERVANYEVGREKDWPGAGAPRWQKEYYWQEYDPILARIKEDIRIMFGIDSVCL